jgi:hypothetical protein
VEDGSRDGAAYGSCKEQRRHVCGWKNHDPMSARVERLLVVLGVCLPIPLAGATGLSIPLPATVERIAAALVPWADAATFEANEALAAGAAGAIVRSPGEDDAPVSARLTASPDVVAASAESGVEASASAKPESGGGGNGPGDSSGNGAGSGSGSSGGGDGTRSGGDPAEPGPGGGGPGTDPKPDPDPVQELVDTVDETTGGAADEVVDTVDETVDTVDETLDKTVDGLTGLGG